MKLNLAVTNKCNMKCKTCNIWRVYQSQPELAKKELKLADYEDFFKVHNHWNWVSFTGGEPFLREDLANIVSIALESCDGLHTISIPTNGYLTETVISQVLKILSNAKLSSLFISISLDGLKTIHDSLRGVNGSFKHAIDTFNKLCYIKDNRLKVHLEYVISKYNQGELPKVIKGLSLTANDFILTVAQNAFFYHNECQDVKPAEDALKSDVEWFLYHFKVRSPDELVQWMFLRHVITGSRIPCFAGRNSFYVDPYGTVFPCVFVPKVLGSIKDGVKDHFNPNPECQCYTPCESYFALLLNFPTSFLTLIR